MNKTIITEGAPLAEPGPYKVTPEGAFGSPGYLVFRPATLDAFPKKDTLPPMVRGNGGYAAAFYGVRHNAGHTAGVFHPGGGEFANVASNWDVRSKGIKE